MNKPAYTHGVRLKGSTGHYEHVDADGLAQMKQALGGERFFAKNYDVQELNAAEKPAPLTEAAPAAVSKANPKSMPSA